MPDTHVFLVPGYVVRPQRYGTDWFLPVAADLPETDLQGHSSGRGTAFRGRKGTKNWFHFPITNPTILSDGRLSCNLAAVTLELENEKAFIEAMHLWDRTTASLILMA